ncbi:MAG TPA: hypothetical protein VF718_02105, partial [Allosphingosinicella sp.]
MSDFLDRMAFRAQGAAPVLRPRPISLYEGAPDLFEEVHEEREAPPPSRPAAHSPPARAARGPSEPGPPGRRAEAGPVRMPQARAEAPPDRERAGPAPVSSPPRS